ncbi:MAG: MarR family winged helix-turn-helix transcriptional regulator [Mycobacteriales bacterium]
MDAIRVPPHFEAEFPGASRSAAELAANLVRTSDAFVAELDRRRRGIADLSASAFQTLAVLEGAAGPLASHEISEHLLVTTASMTSLLNTLERRGLVDRRPHPDDRRKILVAITSEGRRVVDQVLPVVHATATEMFDGIAEGDRERLILLLTAARSQAVAMAGETPKPPPKRRKQRASR